MAAQSSKNDFLHIVERVLPRVRASPIRAMAIALTIFAVGFALRFVIDGWVNQSLPFLTFFVVTLLATLVCGLVPGIVTLVLSFFAAWYFFMPPRYGFDFSAATIVSLAAFAAQGALLVFVAHTLNAIVEKLSFERERSELLLERSARAEAMLGNINGELRHRMKNLFSVISGLISQSARFQTSTSELVGSVSGRLRAMSAAQDLIASNNLLGADLAELVE